MKKIISLFIFLNLIFLPNITFATTMPGVMEYAALIGIAGLIAGLVVGTVILLFRLFTAKTKLTGREYFIMWIKIVLGTPIILLAIFFIIVLIAKLGGGL